MLEPTTPILACGPDPLGMLLLLIGLPAIGVLGVWFVWRAIRSETHRWCLGIPGVLLTGGGVFSLGLWCAVAGV